MLLVVDVLLVLGRGLGGPVVQRLPVVRLDDPDRLQPLPQVLQDARLFALPAGPVARSRRQRGELRLLLGGSAQEPLRDRRPRPRVVGQQLDAGGTYRRLRRYPGQVHVGTSSAERRVSCIPAVSGVAAD